MQIDIRRLEAGSRNGENSFDFSYRLDLTGVKLWGEHPFPEPVGVSGTACIRTDIITLSYKAEYVKHDVCSRCLISVKAAKSDYFEHTVLENAASEDTPGDTADSFINAPGGIIDLDELVLSDILLNQESAALCSPDCKGLCPKCGANFNEASCSCVLKEPDARFAKLFELMNQHSDED